MSHIIGTRQNIPTISIGPNTGAAPTSPNTWTHSFAHTVAPGGTKFLILHISGAILPANNRIEVDLGYDTDSFTSADGSDFWTRPINVNAFPGGLVPIRYITNGAANGICQISEYGRGERHVGEPGYGGFSNADPFMTGPAHLEPEYATVWFCNQPPAGPLWHNMGDFPSDDIRRQVSRAVGMIVTVHTDSVSSCSVTLVGPSLVITAGHCLSAPGGLANADAITSSVIFNYETLAGGAVPGGYSPFFHKVKKVVKHRYDGFSTAPDYSLLQLKTIPVGITPLEMSTVAPSPGTPVFALHHPNGAVKKLSPRYPETSTVFSTTSVMISTGNMDIAGGSSGSGLFDTTGKIHGVLSNGTGCSIRYSSTANLLNSVISEPEPTVDKDLVIVFDKSGSMSLPAGTGLTRLEEAKSAASLFISMVRAGVGHRMGLVTFNSVANTPPTHTISSFDETLRTNLVGPAPHTTGLIFTIAAGGNTTIGGGLEAARLQMPVAGVNRRTILLLTDGLQNTSPLINEVEGALNDFDIHVIGFGQPESLNGELLNALATRHNGLYTRSGDPLDLHKFFALAFGNIFESGTLIDPNFILRKDEDSSKPLEMKVCDEQQITVVLGWSRLDMPLRLRIRMPNGTWVDLADTAIHSDNGRSWRYVRIPLPHMGQAAGTWQVIAERIGGGGEFPPPTEEQRYFINVIANGGPVLQYQIPQKKFFTGDSYNPILVLKNYYQSGHASGGGHDHPEIEISLTVSRPKQGPGNLLSRTKILPSLNLNGDIIPARQNTLAQLQQASSVPIFPYQNTTYELFSNAENTDGAMEAHGIFGRVFKDLFDQEGDYDFHAVANYGHECHGSREVFWSVHVDTGIDGGKTEISFVELGLLPGGKRRIRFTITPKDQYGNLLGPGRATDFTISGTNGATVTGPLTDNGNGTYSADGEADAGADPGVIIQQPGRQATLATPPTSSGVDHEGCSHWMVYILLIMIILALLVWGLFFR